MIFTNSEMWLLTWFIVVNVLGNLALLFSLFNKTERLSEKLIFITLAVTIPMLMLFWIINDIFKRIELHKEKKKTQADTFVYLNNLDEGPLWVKDDFENKQIYYEGPDLIVKTSKGDVKVSYEDMIVKYEDLTLGVIPKELVQEVNRHE